MSGKVFLVCLLTLLSQVQAIYFYLEQGMEKCFKDEVVNNYVSASPQKANSIPTDS